jgi:UPF0176 protein
MSRGPIQIISFYEFKDMSTAGDLREIKDALKEVFREIGIRGTIIIAAEGYNGMVCGEPAQIERFVSNAEKLLNTDLPIKSSFHEKAPFRKIDVKVKREIVTLKRDVNISLGAGTHVDPANWNEVISDPETFLLDARNDYEYQTGTFEGAVNPAVRKFSDLPDFVAQNMDPARHKRVAMFCTGGIRCEKFAPYLKQMGFEEVFQLNGGILKYLGETDKEDSLWQGECFVFDERITVDHDLQKGSVPDHSQRHENARKPRYEIKT